jgi:type I restriction enzyme M protein
MMRSWCSYLRADQLFSDAESLRVSLATFRRIVSKLEKFNLSDTGDDVKGIAFERFLGDTFRGELGQFFTPRPLVNFMVEMLDPQDGEVICDPASGTGGFLIRVFEYLRAQVEREIQAEKGRATRKAELTAKKEKWSDDKLVAALEDIQGSLNKQLNVTDKNSRLYRIAHDCIYGTDAEARAARTSKMNMIMHGDGHGGIHYHDGLLDINGIFEGRFSVVLTNPPFGANVRKDQIVGSTEQTRVEDDDDLLRHYRRRYGADWQAAHDRLLVSSEERQPILELFDIGRDPIGGLAATSKVRPNRPTEQLFIERCLSLLKPGGRMGIVLPDGILNNPSLSWLRQYVEGRARLTAVVSVPQEVFASSKATVKTSLVFLRRFTKDQAEQWQAAVVQATEEAAAHLHDQRTEVAALVRRAEIFDRADTATVIDQIKSISNAKKIDAKALRDARAQLRAMVSTADRDRARALMSEAQSKARELDHQEHDIIRARARELTTHLVFMAEAQTAGITSTGETGRHVPNDLPDLVSAYRSFLDDPDGFAADVAIRLAETDSTVEDN